MQTPETMSSEAALADATALIYREHEHLRQGVAFEQLAGLIAPLERAQRIFFDGNGPQRIYDASAWYAFDAFRF